MGLGSWHGFTVLRLQRGNIARPSCARMKTKGLVPGMGGQVSLHARYTCVRRASDLVFACLQT
jgi:hypothetical protein